MKNLLLALRLISVIPMTEEEEDASPTQLAPYFPVAGFCLGLVLWLAGALLLALMPRATAALVAGLALPILYAVLTRYHGISGLARLLEFWPVLGGEPETPHGT